MNPRGQKPPFKFATVPHGSMETNLMNHHRDMYDYMKAFSKPDAIEGVRAVREGSVAHTSFKPSKNIFLNYVCLSQ